jgi:pilus assembly protein CpaB
MRLPRMAVSVNAVLLGAALALGGVTYWGVGRYVDRRAADTQASLEEAFALEPRVVAAVDVPIGTVLESQHLALRRVPVGFAVSDTLRADQTGLVLGRKAARAMRAGDTVLEAMLQPRDTAPFSEQIATGRRAVTVPVDEVNAIAGLLSPGDSVDLLYYGAAGDGLAATRARVRLLLSGVMVLATGRATRRARVQAPDGTEREIDTEFSTATLSVTPREAQLIALAVRSGELVAALRAPVDEAPLRLDALGTEALIDHAAPQRLRRQGRFIEVIVGGSGAARLSRLGLPSS